MLAVIIAIAVDPKKQLWPSRSQSTTRSPVEVDSERAYIVVHTLLKVAITVSRLPSYLTES